jgi:hypothetical protein
MTCDRPLEDEPCYICKGRAFLCFIQPDQGTIVEGCWDCDAVATAGVFVVQMNRPGHTHELNWHTREYSTAMLRACRRLTAAMRASSDVVSVQVVFVPFDGPRQIVFVTHNPRQGSRSCTDARLAVNGF